MRQVCGREKFSSEQLTRMLNAAIKIGETHQETAFALRQVMRRVHQYLVAGRIEMARRLLEREIDT